MFIEACPEFVKGKNHLTGRGILEDRRTESKVNYFKRLDL
jgi:hypothetical protein